MDTGAQQEFNGYIETPLRNLPFREFETSFAPTSAQQWDLPERDVQALGDFGAPILEAHGGRHGVQLVGDVQESLEPEMRSKLGEAFRLGDYWGQEIGTTKGSGIVLAIPRTKDRSPTYVNSSTAAFAETAWRWCFAWRGDGEHGDPLDQRVRQVECGRMGNQRGSCADGLGLRTPPPTAQKPRALRVPPP